MALLILLQGHSPSIAPGCWLAPNATITGQVTLGEGCTIWFNAVLRGDVAPITLGQGVNVQDGAVLHGTVHKSETTVGDQVSIGHNAIVHGCTIHSRVLIGMGAIVMDNTVVESEVIVAAGAVVPAGKVLKSGYIYAGNPARQLKPIEAEHLAIIMATAENYPKYASWHPPLIP